MAVRMLHQLSALQFSKEHGRGASHIAAEVIEKSNCLFTIRTLLGYSQDFLLQHEETSVTSLRARTASRSNCCSSGDPLALFWPARDAATPKLPDCTNMSRKDAGAPPARQWQGSGLLGACRPHRGIHLPGGVLMLQFDAWFMASSLELPKPAACHRPAQVTHWVIPDTFSTADLSPTTCLGEIRAVLDRWCGCAGSPEEARYQPKVRPPA